MMYSFHLDATGPRISFPANIPAATKTNPFFTWTSSESASFKCAVLVEGNQPNYVNCGQGTSGNWTGLNIPDGAYKFLVYGTDDMNNRGPTKEHRFIVGESRSRDCFKMEFTDRDISNVVPTLGARLTVIHSNQLFETFLPDCKT